MKSLRKLSLDLMKNQSFDTLGVGVIDFKNHSFESFEVLKKSQVEDDLDIFFDLASITKPLTLALTYLSNKKLFDNEMKLLLDHKAGLPAGGRLSQSAWKNEILNYSVKEAPTLYSDYSALRLMLEIEAKQTKSLKQLCTPYYDKNLKNWNDLDSSDLCAVTGFRRGKLIQGEIHDDNALQVGGFLSHAGLFATTDGLCQTLINMDKDLKLLSNMEKAFKSRKERFLNGFDTIENPNDSLAGIGRSSQTFGHLGFTGTSFWIDIEKSRGVVILTNATQSFWYARQRLNHLRKEIGSFIWFM